MNTSFDKSFKKSKETELATWKSPWQTKQSIDLINATYETVFFYWHEHVMKNVELMPCRGNILQIGSVENLLGSEYFEEHGKPITYHFGKLEQEIISKHIIESKFFSSNIEININN